MRKSQYSTQHHRAYGRSHAALPPPPPPACRNGFGLHVLQQDDKLVLDLFSFFCKMTCLMPVILVEGHILALVPTSIRRWLEGGSDPTGPPVLVDLLAFCLILKMIQNSIQKSAQYMKTVKFFNDMLWISKTSVFDKINHQ